MRFSDFWKTSGKPPQQSSTLCAESHFPIYGSDDMLRSAIERKFEIIGEALTRIRNVRADLLPRIREHRTIVSFRNILVHGYDRIDDRIVWGIIDEDVDQFPVQPEPRGPPPRGARWR